jgi:hypothetical protein
VASVLAYRLRLPFLLAGIVCLLGVSVKRELFQDFLYHNSHLFYGCFFLDIDCQPGLPLAVSESILLQQFIPQGES